MKTQLHRFSLPYGRMQTDPMIVGGLTREPGHFDVRAFLFWNARFPPESRASGEAIVRLWRHDAGSVRLRRISSNVRCTLDVDGERHFLRCVPEGERSQTGVEAEIRLLRALDGGPARAAQPVPSLDGRLVETARREGAAYYAVLFESVRRKAAALAEAAEQAVQARPAAPIHFDFEMDNPLRHGEQIGAIDFDDCRLYPPSADIEYATGDLREAELAARAEAGTLESGNPPEAPGLLPAGRTFSIV
ncbi:phosphotransferase [Saccharibacillus sp. CPCC 101409]|uniref:phosphotransferase n=1 Tax=Saccharibacillus sp. CPCC 101409 TaxID=3058041 RepID=UPI0026719085|nr:phosphotransferase [Saccharibacillus sp. CPCC 101409]MDO3411266.1 phosphotransferase [Saccharibacillus sp. CPCC 101409]